ncbi:hypothetical protein HDU76_013973 [Blyttiomyces sp. JEL0837]|nr:hypothetical protein HDU76_013973 [Blyttiomyces sp. JEL0837]
MVADYMMAVAVKEINEDPNILPNTFVKMVQYNNWDPDLSAAWWYTSSGGYALKRAIDVAESGVVAVVGEYFSKTALYSMEAISYYKIPFCGASASSSKLSNRNMYPYSFRLTVGTYIIAKAYTTLLKAWKINRIALVVGFDSFSKEGGKQVEKLFIEAGIKIVTKVALTYSMVDSHDYEQAYNTLLSADARYIFITADSNSVADFYYRAGNFSLISPKHVWMGNNGPLTLDGSNITDTYGKQAADLVNGFIVCNLDFESDSAPNKAKYLETQKFLRKTDEMLDSKI